MRVWLTFLMVLASVAGVRAESLTLALSEEEVRIGSNFDGATLTLFGVVERDAQTVARPGRYEIVVVVRGPTHELLVQRRVRRLGIWVNGASQRFADVPSYQAVFTSVGGRELVEGEDGQPPPAAIESAGPAERGLRDRQDYSAAIAARAAASGLYRADYAAVGFLTRTFFRVPIPLPPLVSDGDYAIDVWLYSDTTLVGSQEAAFRVRKIGFEQSLFELSRERPLVYGLATVALALVTGYVGGIVFRRN